jgi:hypothetical protein
LQNTGDLKLTPSDLRSKLKDKTESHLSKGKNLSQISSNCSSRNFATLDLMGSLDKRFKLLEYTTGDQRQKEILVALEAAMYQNIIHK